MPDSTHYVAGLFAGFAQTIVGHPFDTIKTTLQSEGVRGLFAGISSPMLSSIVFSSILFGSYENFKQLYSQGTGDDQELSSAGHIAACVSAGVVETTCYAPFEHVKTQLQTRYGRPNVGLLNTVVEIYTHSGIRGAYRGYVAQLWRECPGNVVYFGVYDTSRNLLTARLDETVLSKRTLLAGGVSGVCYWSATYPLDVVKSRMQAQELERPVYSSFRDCVRKTYQEFGVRGFFRGIGPCLLRAFPANAAAFGAYEYVKHLIVTDRLSLTSTSL